MKKTGQIVAIVLKEFYTHYHYIAKDFPAVFFCEKILSMTSRHPKMVFSYPEDDVSAFRNVPINALNARRHLVFLLSSALCVKIRY